MLIKNRRYGFVTFYILQSLSYMQVAHSIEELLYRYNCVIVPGFGAFLTQRKPATIHQTTNTFYPPSKVLSFNEQLSSNDGLLVSHLAQIEKSSYDEMLHKVGSIADQWKAELMDNKRLTLANIGEFWLNKAGKIQFQPSNQVNYLTSSFGLSSFVSPPAVREVLKEEVQDLEERIPFVITPERRGKFAVGHYFKYAAVILLALSAGFTGYRFFNGNSMGEQLAQKEAQVQVAKKIQEATFFSNAPLELPALTLDIKSSTKTATHQIIAGAYRVQGNADKRVRELRAKGYDSNYIGVNKYGLHLVTYGGYDDAETALINLRKIKRTESGEAWLLSSK